MAKICIVIAQGTGGFEVGDVAFCKEDDAPWGTAILKNPKFRLIDLPGMTGREATEYFCAAQPGDPRENPDLKKRAVRLDVAALTRGAMRGDFEEATLSKLQAVRQVKVIPSRSGVR